MPTYVEPQKALHLTKFYNLGAQSFVGHSFEQPLFTTDVTAGLARIGSHRWG